MGVRQISDQEKEVVECQAKLTPILNVKLTVVNK